jgi:hypothetical protein
MIRFLILTGFFLLAIVQNCFGQTVGINPGVDTTDEDIKAVITLWTNYLKSKPTKDNIKDSPYWAESEKKNYPKVDQLLNAVSTDGSTYSMGYPTILYVKPKKDFWEIKTVIGMFDDSSKSIEVIAITSVYAKKENGAYKLYNALTVNSSEWQTQKLGSVTFHYPPAHTFDKEKAGKLLQSIDDLIKEWKLQPIPIDYYFADTYEEIEHLEGLDYCVGDGNKDKPRGRSDQETNTVFSGGLGENYFHEVAHIYLDRLFPNSPLTHGLVVFYGGSMGHDLKWHLARLDTYLDQHKEVDLSDPEHFWYTDNFTNPATTIDGLLCYMAYKKGGLEEVKKLLSYTDIYTAIEKEFGVKKDGLNTFLREQIKLNKN